MQCGQVDGLRHVTGYDSRLPPMDGSDMCGRFVFFVMGLTLHGNDRTNNPSYDTSPEGSCLRWSKGGWGLVGRRRADYV